MHLGIVLETNDPERVWNAFRLANTALESDHPSRRSCSVTASKRPTSNTSSSIHTG